jgi:competence protein ComEC
MSQPLVGWGAAVVLGAAVWPWLSPPPASLLVAGAVLLGVALLGHRCSVSAWIAPAVGLLLGLLAPWSLPSPPDLTGPRRVVGTVTARAGGAVDLDAGIGRLRVRLAGDVPPPGARVAAWVRPARAGDRLPGEPDPAWAAARARRTRVVARQWVRLGADEAPAADPFAHARHAGLLRALTGGGARAAPRSQVDLLTRTGTRHLLAVSGLHIGLVAGGAALVGRLLFAPLGLLRWAWPVRVLPPLCGLAAGVAFAARAGWPTSTRRALALFAVGSVAWVLGRRPRPGPALGLVAGCMVLADPGLPGDLGFRLSFGAVAGILLVAPRITRLLPPDRPWPVRWAVRSIAATIGATAGTLPDAAWTFQALSPWSPVANLLALPPLAGVAVPAALLGIALPGAVGQVAVALADGCCGLALDALGVLDRVPWTPAVGPLGAVGLGLAVLARRRPGVAGLLLLLGLSLRPVPAGRLAVTFLAVGQGDGALVEHPDGRRWLVDGGPSGADVLGWLRRSGVRRLDAVVLSHPHPDHMAGLVPVLRAMPVGRVFVPRPPERGEAAYLAFWQAAWASGARVGPPGPGEGGVRWLHPGGDFGGEGRARVNDESLVLELAHGGRRILLTGDVERAAEAALAPRLDTVDVVKAAHHGSRTSSTVPFVASLEPDWVVLSVGTGSRHGHPHAQTLGRWKGARRVRTDRDGSVRFVTDGAALRVTRWHPLLGWSPLERAPWRPRSPGRRTPVAIAEDASTEGVPVEGWRPP